MIRFDLQFGHLLCDHWLVQYLTSIHPKERLDTMINLLVPDLANRTWPESIPRFSLTIRETHGPRAQAFLSLLERIPPRKRLDTIRFLLLKNVFQLHQYPSGIIAEAPNPQMPTPLPPESLSARQAEHSRHEDITPNSTIGKNLLKDSFLT